MFAQMLLAVDPTAIVKEAYDKDFRWWFLMLLVLVLSGGLWSLRYLVNQAEEQRKAHAESVRALVTELSESRKHHHDRMEGMQAEAFRMVREVTAVVAANNTLIESNTRESEKVRLLIDRWGHPDRDRERS